MEWTHGNHTIRLNDSQKFVVVELDKAYETMTQAREAADRADAAKSKVDEAVATAKAGERVTHKKVKAAKEKAAPKEKPQQVEVKRVEPEPPPEPEPESAPKLDPQPWAPSNADCEQAIQILDQFGVFAERIHETVFGKWIDLKGTKQFIESEQEKFRRWQVAGFKPQWEIGPDGRNFYYAFEKQPKKKGGKK
jgi:hypothetical protein